jgi:PAS domain S-box-containing protein
MILIIAWIDQITPAEFSVRLLYLVPIFLSIWYDKGIKLGIFFSILSTFLYYYGNIQNGIYNLHGIYVIWELVGVCGFFIVFVVSIGKLKKSNIAIQQKESHFRNLFNNSEVGMFRTRLDGSEILDFNEKYLKILNYTREEIEGKPSLNVWADKNERDKMVGILKTYGYVTDLEFDLLTKYGEVKRCITSLRLYPETGILEGSIVDITERKREELIIQQQNNQLQELNAAKDKFFSIIAHDLRSPFQVFLSLTQNLAEEATSYSLQELSDISSSMHQTANNLFLLLKNLLEWAQMQNGSMGFQPIELSLSELIAENVEMMMEREKQKGITLINNVTDQVYAYADDNMIKSVLSNLLTNAIKFTPRNGTVTINAKNIENKMVEISVIDTGVGIPKDILEKLFRVGEKINSKGTEGELSIGLGLLLCKEFVEKHGGKIWVESEQGVGSTFYFTLRSAG